MQHADVQTSLTDVTVSRLEPLKGECVCVRLSGDGPELHKAS